MSTPDQPILYRSRMLVTMDQPPLENGAVIVDGTKIREIGKFSDLSSSHTGKTIDLGEQILMPGLINAHCHLDYTLFRNSIPPPKNFTDWITQINALKRTLSEEDYIQSIHRGFEEALSWGTTTLLNIESFPELMPKLATPPIRTWWFYELIDIRQRIATDEVIAGAFFFFEHQPEWLGGFGLSPHAPYTASRKLFKLANECAARMPDILLTTHVSESREEMEMFLEGSGSLHRFLSSLGRSMKDCGKHSPLEYLLKNNLAGPGWILAHLNELEDQDYKLLESLPEVHDLHIVHCPKSHSYFQHRPFEFKRLMELGTNICLGTDSLASNDSLSLFSEMRLLLHNNPWLDPETILKTVTVNPARALKKEKILGKLSPGAAADMIALPFSGDTSKVFERIITQANPINWVLVNGKTAKTSAAE